MLTLIALSAALIQDPPAPPAPPAAPEVRTHFAFVGDGPNRLDANGDGEVTREEFTAPMTDAFARIDKNGDGRISGEEMAEHHGPEGHDVVMMRHPGGPEGPGPHRFQIRVPHPGGEGGGEERDVVIMRRPGGGEGPHRFEMRVPHPGAEGVRVERDGERTMVFVGQGGPGEREIVVHGGPGGEHPRMMRMPHGDMGPGEHRVEVHTLGEGHGHADMDKDGDGKISEAEFVGPLREAFARIDADRSGFIEAGERGEEHDVRVFTRTIEHRDEE